MDSIQIQKEAAIWMSSASPKDRCGFLKTLIGMLDGDEIARIDNKVSKRKKELKDKGLMKRKRSDIPSEPPRPVREVLGDAQALTPIKDKPWYNIYNKNDCVSIDCEHVHLKHLQGIQRIRAATVSIVNWKGEEIYNAMIYHEPGSFLVSKHTKAVNGFAHNSLVNGRPAQEITKEVRNLLQDKFIIHWGGAIDFSSLDLDIGNFPANFDLATHFKRESGVNKYDEPVFQSINLESVYFHFYSTRIQDGIHSCKDDAVATMKLFIEKYKATKYDIKSPVSTKNDWAQFECIVNVKKNKL